jgi:VIT1/CCC1 family predicted Fe2+/Mn2+ transporter
MTNWDNIEDEILTDIAVQLLVLEGVPFLAFVYYLLHKKQMYLLEKGIEEKDNKKIRSERRIINGLFLILAGASMILAPNFAAAAGIEAHLSFELLLASLVVLCAGTAMIIGEELIKYKAGLAKDRDGLEELK